MKKLRIRRINIKYIIRKALCDTSFGNPLNLREGEVEPTIYVTKTDKGFRISVDCMSADFDDVSSLENIISGCLRGKYGNYAVVTKEEDIAGRYVDYYVEDVVAGYSKQSVFYSVADVPSNIKKAYIRDDVYIDYSKVLNSSAIVAGRSRSGKTTAIISTFLIPFGAIACSTMAGNRMVSHTMATYCKYFLQVMGCRRKGTYIICF